MIWKSVYFNKKLEDYELIEAVCKVFDIKSEEVILVRDVIELLHKNSKNINNKIICEVFLLNNNIEFKTRVDFNLDDSLEPKNDIVIYSKLINELNCKILIDNYTSSPEAMLIIEAINLDDDILDFN